MPSTSKLIFAVFLFLAPLPASANTPPPIYPRDIGGPYIACRPGIAIPVKVGETMHVIGSTDILYFAGGELAADTFLQDPVRDADIVHFRGALQVPGLGQVTRYELTSRNSSDRAIGYVFYTGKPDFWGTYRVLFRSTQFTGTDSDVAILSRAISGAEAEKMCAVGRQ